ncbi:CRISPR-associated ring nuclease Crn1 [Acidianus ambivalens]|uniref:CRISPR-associated protein n=1 Tax=Acidianus ambivalens TaxID=2283 RepID=A0A650CWE5_ACIAM|nr:CRISPR-associated ring nuclease Crn1 [Acidianus ambivalens]MQL54266.1 hypothetical protein [Acidianus ambivalens]QGR22093.1 hypothetical protein D1866_08915 [Acidianus ambivalens]
MPRLVSTLGKSPGGIAETLINLTDGNYVAPFDPVPIKIEELLVVKTKEVEESFYVLKALLLCCSSFVNVRAINLPFDDVNSPNDFVQVRETIRKVLKAGDYLDFTGGRKAISSAAVLAAREAGAHLVSSIIPHEEYDSINKKFNAVKDRAMKIYKKEDCVSYVCDLISKNSRTIVFF